MSCLTAWPRVALLLSLLWVVATAGGAEPAPPELLPGRRAATCEDSVESPATTCIHTSGAPSERLASRMADWHRRYESQMAPVKGAWLGVLRALENVGPAAPDGLLYLDERCAEIRRALGGLARAEMLPSPDPVVDLHLLRTLASLRQAASVCEPERFFYLTYRLDGAGSAFLETARLMRLYGLAP